MPWVDDAFSPYASSQNVSSTVPGLIVAAQHQSAQGRVHFKTQVNGMARLKSSLLLFWGTRMSLLDSHQFRISRLILSLLGFDSLG
jgi:hypothetical protein